MLEVLITIRDPDTQELLAEKVRLIDSKIFLEKFFYDAYDIAEREQRSIRRWENKDL